MCIHLQIENQWVERLEPTDHEVSPRKASSAISSTCWTQVRNQSTIGEPNTKKETWWETWLIAALGETRVSNIDSEINISCEFILNDVWTVSSILHL